MTARGVAFAVLICAPLLMPLTGSNTATADEDARQGEVLNLILPVLDISTTTGSSDDSLSTTESAAAEQIVISADIAFAFDEAALSATAADKLAAIAVRVDAVARGVVHVDGYTDSLGSAAYNHDLSNRRAQAVAGALRSLIKRDGLTFVATGHGSDQPVAPNETDDGLDNPQGRALNRRVSISFEK